MLGSVPALGTLQGTVDREPCHQWERQTPTRKYACGMTSGSGKHGEQTEPLQRGRGAQDTVGRPVWPEQSEPMDKVGRLLGAAGPVFGLWFFGLWWGVGCILTVVGG